MIFVQSTAGSITLTWVFSLKVYQIKEKKHLRKSDKSVKQKSSVIL